MKRLFTATPFASQQFDQWYRDIRMKYPDFEWYLPRDLHITLQFLGNVADDLATTVEERLQKIQLNTQQIHFTTTRPQAFFKKGKPFVVWMGLDADATLNKLYQDSSKQLRGLYQDRNMEYIPHITLFRCKNTQEQAVAQFLEENQSLLDHEGQITRFCLFEANLEDEINRYQVLKCFNL
jgi:RNA 2',3'-cyclic 3'-phosphodiesterase